MITEKQWLDNPLLLELGRVREILRREFPDVCDKTYVKAQQSPEAVAEYVRAVLLEVKKKGKRTNPLNPSSTESLL